MHKQTPLSQKFNGFERDSATAGWESFRNKKLVNTPIAEKFKGFEKSSVAASWEGFEQRRKKKAFMVFWSVKFPLLLALAGLLWVNSQKSYFPLTDKVENQTSLFEDKEVLESNEILVKDKSEKQQEAPSIDIKRITRSNNNLYASGRDDRGKKKMFSGNGIKANEEMVTAREELESGFSNESINYNLEQLKLELAHLRLLEIEQEKLSPIDFDPDYKLERNPYWALTLSAGPTLTIPKVKANPEASKKANKYYLEARNGAEVPSLGFEVNVGLQYRYLLSLSLKTGIGYSKYSVGGSYKHNIDSVPLVDIDGSISYLPPNMDTFNSQPPRGSAGYSYSYLSIPLGVVKEVPLNKNWNVIMDIGAELSFLMNANGVVLDEVYLDETTALSSSSLRKINVNMDVGLGLSNNLNKKTSIGFMLKHKRFASPINKKGYFSTQNNSYGFLILTTHKF